MNDALSIARDLLRCPSVTPADAGALGVLENILKAAGFEVHRVTFSEPGTADIDNLYARIGTSAPHITFAGHTDVVPPGDETAWSHGAFSGEVKDGLLYGRGAVDMKGGIACSVAAVLDYLADHGGKPKGSISFLITGDEEDDLGQRHRQAAAMGRGARREIRPLRARRAQQCRGARRLHQDRPPRLAIGHAVCRRRAGPCRLSASRRQSGAGYFAADRGAERRAARSRQRAIPGVEPRIHLGRCRQHRQQRDPGPGAREIQHPLQRSTTPRNRCANWSRQRAGQGRRQPDPRADRVGAVQLQRVRDQARRRSPISRSPRSRKSPAASRN